MNNRINIEDLLSSEGDEIEEDTENLTDEEIKALIPKQPATKLADIVISFRYLGLYKDLSVLAMEELANRRLNGDTFQYEKYIEDNLKSLPKLNFNLSSLDDLIKNFIKF